MQGWSWRERDDQICVCDRTGLFLLFWLCTFPKGGTLLLIAAVECGKSCPWPTQDFISCEAEQAGAGFERVITEGALASKFLTTIGHGKAGPREGGGKSK